MNRSVRSISALMGSEVGKTPVSEFEPWPPLSIEYSVLMEETLLYICRNSSSVGQVSRSDQISTTSSSTGTGSGSEGFQREISPEARLVSNAESSNSGKGVVGEAGRCCCWRVGVVGGDAMVNTSDIHWSVCEVNFPGELNSLGEVNSSGEVEAL